MSIVFQLGSGAWQQASLVPHPNQPGYFIAVRADGWQFSMQPKNADGWRDPAVGQGNGPWEACKRSGNVLCWTTGDGTESYVRLMAER